MTLALLQADANLLPHSPVSAPAKRLYWHRISPCRVTTRASNYRANLTEEHTKCTVE